MSIATENDVQSKVVYHYKNSANTDPCFLYAHILNDDPKPSGCYVNAGATRNRSKYVSETTARNRFGRPYISGCPLLTCDRKRIIDLHKKGIKNIKIAQELGVTHGCVSKVIKRYTETGCLEARNSRTASCACPGGADQHDLRICHHMRYENYFQKKNRLLFTVEWYCIKSSSYGFI